MAAFFAALPPCIVGIEACGTAHFWAREIARCGHDLRLMPPGYVKPYVKRNKHDAADAKAVCEAVRRPSAVKTMPPPAGLDRGERGAPAEPGRDEETALRSNKENEERKLTLTLPG